MTTTSAAPVVERLPPLPDRDSRMPLGPYFVFLVLIGASIPWRSKTYFEGGLDPVVIAKAVLIVFALGCAVLVAFNRPVRELRSGPVVFLSLYLGITMVGAWATGDLAPALVIGARVLLVAATVVVLSRVFEGAVLLRCLVVALATYALLGAATGVGNLAEGRLAGGFPPLHPNELASTCAIVVLWCLWRMLAGQDTWLHLVAITVAFGMLVATASRTPLVAMAVAAVLLLLRARAIRTPTLVFGLVLLPVVCWVLVGTEFVRNLLTRGTDPSGLATLSNRTIAWEAALAPKGSPWLTWFGGGLPVKRIEVPGQYWETQILDSSWISALVQGGYLGLVVCAIWVLSSLFATVHSPSSLRTIQLALLVYLTLRGFLESGLFDASTSFLLFFATAMATPLRPWQPYDPPSSWPSSVGPLVQPAWLK